MLLSSSMAGFRPHDTSVFERDTLSNGIPVFSQRCDRLLSDEGILIAVLPRVGARLDPPYRLGVAHPFEHIVWRGTKNFPSKEAITGPLFDAGGDDFEAFGAGVWPDYTFFYIRLPVKAFPLAVALLFELLHYPKLTAEDLDLERGPMRGEWRAAHADGRRMSKMLSWQALLKGHPLGNDPLGDEDVIETVGIEELRSFHKTYYHAGNIALICGGAFGNLPNAVSELEQSFGVILRGKPPFRVSALPVALEGGNVEVCESSCGRDYLIFNFPSAPFSMREHALATDFARFVALGSDSLFYQELREKRSLVYEQGILWPQQGNEVANMVLSCATPRNNFPLVRSLYRDLLTNVTSDYIAKRMQRRDERRPSERTDPIAACYFGAGPQDTRYCKNSALEEVVAYGDIISHHQWEKYRNGFDVSDFLAFRDKLLEQEPFEVRILCG
jgi:predicted Zn-dependent peptidase